MASFTAPLYKSDVFNPALFDYASESLTLDTADKRYLKLTGGAITGNLFVSGLVDCGSLSIAGSPISLDYISGITAGVASPSKALVLNSSSNITGINSLSSTSLIGTTLTLGGASLTATQINYLAITPGAASASKALVTDSSLNISGINSLGCGYNVYAGGSVNPASLASSVANVAWYYNGDRYYMQRLVTANTWSLLTLSAGGNYNDALTYTHSASPVLSLTSATGTISAYNFSATTQITSPLVNCVDAITAGTAGIVCKMGHTSTAASRWYWEAFNASTNSFNCHMTFWNQNLYSTGVFGLNLGTGSGASSSGGAMMVLNAVSGSGTFISCANSTALATLHINGGVSQSVNSGWQYTSSGSSSFPTSTVLLSLYCYNNAWIRGALYCTSDGRLKNIVGDIDEYAAMNLLKVKSRWFKWKTDPEDIAPQLGIIAQDLVDNGLKELTQLFDNEDIKEADEALGIPAGKQLVVSYDRIPLYLLEIIKLQQSQIDDLNNKVDKLIASLPRTKKDKFLNI